MRSPHDLPLILKLDSPDATLDWVGGKGASLARLAAVDGDRGEVYLSEAERVTVAPARTRRVVRLAIPLAGLAVLALLIRRSRRGR